VNAQEQSYGEALSKYERVKQTEGSRADVLYGIAVCQYKLKDYKSAIVGCSDIISNATKDHPGRSVSASVTLQIFLNAKLIFYTEYNK